MDSENKTFCLIQNLFANSYSTFALPSRKTPTRKIPTHQTPPWWIPSRKIPTRKIPTHVFKYSHPGFLIFLFFHYHHHYRYIT